MSTLELEIIEKFRLLDKEARQRLLAHMREEFELNQENFGTSEVLSSGDWQAWASTFRSQLRQHYGDRVVMSSAELLEEAREERLDDLMGGR